METDLRFFSIGELGKVFTGKTPRTNNPEFYGKEYPFYTPSDMDGSRFLKSTKRYLSKLGMSSVRGSIIEAGSVMVSCIGSDMGKVTIAPRKGVTNQQINTICPYDWVDSLYLYYSLCTRKKELQSLAMGGSALPILNKSSFCQIKVEIPPFHKQKAIANILESLDKKIELNNKTNETLDDISKVLFKSWFIDFDPIKAKVEGRSTGLPDEFSDLFPDSLEDSELGSIPRGWKIHKLRDFIDIKGGLSYKSQFIGSGKNLITMGCISPRKKFNFSGLKKYSGDFKESNLLRHKDIIISTRDITQDRVTLGAPAMVPNILDGSIVATNLYKVIFMDQTLSCYFLFESIKTKRYRENIIASAKGSTVLMLTRDSVLDYRIMVPKDDLMNKFHDLYEIMQSRYELINNEIETLVDLRDNLLPKLISGELRITDAEKMIDEVGI